MSDRWDAEAERLAAFTEENGGGLGAVKIAAALRAAYEAGLADWQKGMNQYANRVLGLPSVAVGMPACNSDEGK